MEKVIIMGAAGRDFHNFNVYFRDNERYQVVCFTTTQIPDIEGRQYPAALAGKLYPDGIPIYADEKLFALVKENRIDLVAFSYSDVPHAEVMHKASVISPNRLCSVLPVTKISKSTIALSKSGKNTNRTSTWAP